MAKNNNNKLPKFPLSPQNSTKKRQNDIKNPCGLRFAK